MYGWQFRDCLCNMIPRFFDFDSGDIKIDGISIKSVKSQFDIIPNLQELIDKMVMYKE